MGLGSCRHGTVKLDPMKRFSSTRLPFYTSIKLINSSFFTVPPLTPTTLDLIRLLLRDTGMQPPHSYLTEINGPRLLSWLINTTFFVSSSASKIQLKQTFSLTYFREIRKHWYTSIKHYRKEILSQTSEVLLLGKNQLNFYVILRIGYIIEFMFKIML